MCLALYLKVCNLSKVLFSLKICTHFSKFCFIFFRLSSFEPIFSLERSGLGQKYLNFFKKLISLSIWDKFFSSKPFLFIAKESNMLFIFSYRKTDKIELIFSCDKRSLNSLFELNYSIIGL